MQPYTWFRPAVAIGLALAALLGLTPPALAQGLTPVTSPASDQDLAKTYAHVLYFHPDEPYRPQPVEVMIATYIGSSPGRSGLSIGSLFLLCPWWRNLYSMFWAVG